MQTVSEAEKIILSHALTLEPEIIGLHDALGRILTEDLVADRDFPPFDRVTMDGIAIQYQQFEQGLRAYPIAGVQAAGMPQGNLVLRGGCVEVMTGTMLPLNTDTVIPYENLHIENGVATIQDAPVNFQQNVHFQGIDRKTNDLLVAKGKKIGAAEIATAATVGKHQVAVIRLPRVAIISTGDELVAIDQTPLPHQIRSSNAFAIRAMLAEQFRIDAQLFHYPDNQDKIRQGLWEIFSSFEIVILSGAVSEGKYDFVPKVLPELGVEKNFHKVAQRPGKPFWFGRLPGKTVVFALPGNPVSAFLCTRRYVVPFINLSIGQEPQAPEMVILAEQITFMPKLTYFIPVRVVSAPDGKLLAHPLPGHGSGDLANLNDADGFLELPLEQDVFLPGMAFIFHRYRP